MWFSGKGSDSTEVRYTKKAKRINTSALQPAIDKARRKIETQVEELSEFQGMANGFAAYGAEASASLLNLAEISVGRARKLGLWLDILEKEAILRGIDLEH